MNSPPEDDHLDLQIAEIVTRWPETPRETRLTENQLIAAHPELAPGLAECLRGMQQIENCKSEETIPGTDYDAELDFETTEFPTIPDFEVIGELGRGGMGVVYEARQIPLDRIVALKVLPTGAVDPRAVKRFLREAETVASLCHPGIVPVYAVGVHNGLNWFAMQRIDGCPLSQWFAVSTFESRAAAIDEVVRIAIEAAESLEHAHQRGIIHRDVKPGNLLIDTAGHVWLTDFGLARRDVDVTATASGAMLGTPRYMSAEQITSRDEQIDLRTDIYSLGATLYEMATGRPPFTAESPFELLTQIRQDEPIALRQLDNSIPRPLELVILKCLDKEPERRYQSAAALAEDLRSVRDDKPITAKGLPTWVVVSRFVKRNQRQVNAAVVTTLATVGTLIAGVLLWQQNEAAKLGSLRINTPAGLYVANIQSRENSQSGIVSQAPGMLQVTTPMLQPVTLPAGDYQVRLDAVGQTSQVLDLVVNGNILNDVEYVDRREPRPHIDIYQELAVTVHGNLLAVLGKDSFEVFDPETSEMRIFSLPIAELDASLREETSGKNAFSGTDDPPLTFAFDANQPFQGDYSVIHSGFARLERIASAQTDLDGDGQLDYLITAARHAAIAAVSATGKILWKKRLPMSFEIPQALSQFAKNGMANEAIVGITKIDDVNDDGVDDLVLNASLFDASGYSRPFLFTLSGVDGSQLGSAPQSTIDMRSTRPWPWSGLLQHHRTFNSASRRATFLTTHFENISMRSRATNLESDAWSGNSANSALSVLPPPIVEKIQGNWIAITASQKELRFTRLPDGTEVCSPVVLAQPMLRAPRRVRLEDGKLAVVVLTTSPNTANTKCFIELIVQGESKPRWSIPQDIGANDLVFCAADSSFPLVADLDEDGFDEILTTTNRDAPSKWPQVNCFSASGELRWTSGGVAGISPIVDRAIPIHDLNGDGSKEIVLVGLTSEKNYQSNRSANADLRLNLEFHDGKTGQRLGYRDELVATGLKFTDIAEIDYVELLGQELICSVVYGSKDELKLSSTTIHFDLADLSGAKVASGLTVLGPGNSQTNSTDRWYRRRSGPFAKAADVAVWFEKDREQSTYPGETYVAAWRSHSGQPRVMLRHNTTARCINPLDGRTLWSKEIAFWESNDRILLKHKNGQVDFVGQESWNSKYRRLFDAETGRSLFTLSHPSLNELTSASVQQLFPQTETSKQTAFLLLSNHSISHDPTQQSKVAMALLKLDSTQGRVVWSNIFANKTSATRQMQSVFVRGSLANLSQLYQPIQVDINNDNIPDVVLGGVSENNLVVRAIDGRKGDTIWERSLHDSGTVIHAKKLPNASLMTLVHSNGQSYLVLLEQVANQESLIELKSLQLADGEVVGSKTVQLPRKVFETVSLGHLSLYVPSPTKRDGIVGIVSAGVFDTSSVATNLRSFLRLSLVQVNERSGALVPLESSDVGDRISDTKQYGDLSEILMVDIDGDQILEQVEKYAAGQIVVRESNTSKELSRFETRPKHTNLRIEKTKDRFYAVLSNTQEGCEWYELPSGRPALRVGQELESTRLQDQELPFVLEHGQGNLLVGTTPEAVTCIDVGLDNSTAQILEAKPLAVVMVAANVDPKYRKLVTAYGVFHSKSLADVIRLGLLSIGAVLLPLGFFVQLIRRRSWSLRALLLAPAITLTAIICWRSLLSNKTDFLIPDLIAGAMAAMTTASIYFMLRHQQWRLLAISTGLSVLTGTLIMYGAQATLPTRFPGAIGYWTVAGWLSAIAAAAAQIVAPFGLSFAWGLRKLAKAKHRV